MVSFAVQARKSIRLLAIKAYVSPLEPVWAVRQRLEEMAVIAAVLATIWGPASKGLTWFVGPKPSFSSILSAGYVDLLTAPKSC